jgi:hypothetical protein
MKARAKSVILSHLSDAKAEVSRNYSTEDILHNLEFIKFLTMQFGNNLEQEIDSDKTYETFLKSLPKN